MGILLKCRFRFRRSGAGPENVHLAIPGLHCDPFIRDPPLSGAAFSLQLAEG